MLPIGLNDHRPSTTFKVARLPQSTRRIDALPSKETPGRSQVYSTVVYNRSQTILLTNIVASPDLEASRHFSHHRANLQIIAQMLLLP